MSEEIFTKRKNFMPGKFELTSYWREFTDTLSNLESNIGDSFEKKVIKICKAMRVMEQAKGYEPKFSEAFQDLAKHFSKNRKDTDSMSRMSSMGIGDNFKSSKIPNVRDYDDATSNFTAVNNQFNSVFGPAP